MSDKVDIIKIEQSILGSLMADNSLCEYVDELCEEMFSNEMNREIFAAMKKARIASLSVDINTVATKLKAAHKDIKVSYMSDLISVSQSWAFDSHIKILKDTFVRKCMIDSANMLTQMLKKGDNLDKSLHNFENNIKLVVDSQNLDDDSVVEICDSLTEYFMNEDEEKFSFNINILDDIIGGMFKGEMTTIAARSGVGKTALALQIMINSVRQGKRVLFISREMSKEQIFMRNLCHITGISISKMKTKSINEKEYNAIFEEMSKFCSDNLVHINDNISGISEIKRRIRQVKPDLVIVDYIQLLSIEEKMQTREREVASISRELKNISLDFSIPVIALSQLNDEMKDFRPFGERPMRDSKAIFHDSNNVVYIHEPVGDDFEKACKNIGETTSRVSAAKSNGIKLLDLIVAKCRDGRTDYRHYSYNGKRFSFREIVY